MSHRALGEQFGPRPEYDESKGYDYNVAAKRAWTTRVRVGMSEGRLSPKKATDLGYTSVGADSDYSGGLSWGPLPATTYHATTDMPSVLSGGLKTRRELRQRDGGHGLGGGEDALSLTTDPQVAHDIVSGMHVMHGILHGKTGIDDVIHAARTGADSGGVPYYDHMNNRMTSSLGKNWERKIREGVTSSGVDVPKMVTAEDAAKEGWRPTPWATGFEHKGKTLYGSIELERDVTPDEHDTHLYHFAQAVLSSREQAGGPSDPVFFTTDIKAFKEKDPAKFGVVKVSHDGSAHGYPIRGMGEWRTESGRNLRVERHTG